MGLSDLVRDNRMRNDEIMSEAPVIVNSCVVIMALLLSEASIDIIIDPGELSEELHNTSCESIDQLQAQPSWPTEGEVRTSTECSQAQELELMRIRPADRADSFCNTCLASGGTTIPWCHLALGKKSTTYRCHIITCGCGQCATMAQMWQPQTHIICAIM